MSHHSGELFLVSFCCDAMQEELKSGDMLVLDRTNGPGMTVRYILPRD